MKSTRFSLAITAAILVIGNGSAFAHGGEEHSHDDKAAASLPAASGSPQRLADGSLFVPKPVQYQLGLRTVVVDLGALTAGVEFNGRVIADPNAGGRVQATQPGRIEPGPKGLPMLGEQVSKGQVLAHLRRHAPVRFELEVVTVDPGTDGFRPEPLRPYVAALGLRHHFVRVPIAERAEQHMRGSSFSAFSADS